MHILFITEGTYPYVMGGVSTWCDQIIGSLDEHTFHVLAIVGPVASEPVYPRLNNIKKLSHLSIWKPRTRVRAPRKKDYARFETGLNLLLGMLDKDVLAFSEGLRQLATLGDHVNLWPLFEKRKIWRLVHAHLHKLLPYNPSLAEIALCVNWLKSALVPLLFIPPKADVVHTVTNGLAAVPAWLASKLHGVPLVVTEHGVYLRERYLGFSDEGDTPALKLLRASFYQTLSRLMYQHADRVLSVSAFNRSWQLELGSSPDRTRVIPNGVAPGELIKLKPQKQDEPTVVWVGRIDPLKDLETLINAFAETRRHLPKAVLKLFGPVPEGNERYHKTLLKQVKDLDLADAVFFMGEVNPVEDAFVQADVVALSSVSEGFPYTVIEAMMCAKAIVATRVGGVGEALGETGKLVPPQQALAFAKKLVELLENDTLRLELGRRARSRALNNFTLEHMLVRYRHVYDTLFAPASLSFDEPLILVNGEPFNSKSILSSDAEDFLLIEGDT